MEKIVYIHPEIWNFRAKHHDNLSGGGGLSRSREKLHRHTDEMCNARPTTKTSLGSVNNTWCKIQRLYKYYSIHYIVYIQTMYS